MGFSEEKLRGPNLPNESEYERKQLALAEQQIEIAEYQSTIQKKQCDLDEIMTHAINLQAELNAEKEVRLKKESDLDTLFDIVTAYRQKVKGAESSSSNSNTNGTSCARNPSLINNRTDSEFF